MLRQTFLLSVLIAALLFACLNANAQKHAVSNPEWTNPYPPFRISGNLYYVGSYDLACYLIVTKAGHILINQGLEETVPLLKKNIEKLGFKIADIKILLNSQAHFDHVGGTAAIKKATGAKVLITEGDAEVLANGGTTDFLFGGKGKLFEPVGADKMLHDGDTVSLGDMKIIVLSHPGHTKGAVSFMMNVKDEKRVWKVLIANMPTILPESKFPSMPSFPNIGKDYQYTLDAMKKLEFDIWMCAHASQFELHEKHKPGDSYNPSVFANRKIYDKQLDEISKQLAEKMSGK